jgi:hypothetical protein
VAVEALTSDHESLIKFARIFLSSELGGNVDMLWEEHQEACRPAGGPGAFFSRQGSMQMQWWLANSFRDGTKCKAGTASQHRPQKRSMFTRG